MTAALVLKAVSIRDRDGHQLLAAISLDLDAGASAFLIGGPSSGKSTLLRAISGLVPFAGSIIIGGRSIAGLKPHAIPRLGVAHVPAGRGTLASLTVEENLRVAATGRNPPAATISPDVEQVYAWFPPLGLRHRQLAGRLSGGEQQMLAIGRGLMLRPRLLLLDEPTLGLAPEAVAGLSIRLASLTATEVAILVAEQDLRLGALMAGQTLRLEAGRLAS